MLTNLLRILFVSVFILLSYTLPFFHLRRWNRLSATDALALSFATGSLIFGTATFTTHLIDVNQMTAHWAILVLLALSIIPGIRGALIQLKHIEPLPLTLYLLFLGLILSLQAAFPIYIGGFWYFDWWQHYNLSQMYLGDVPHDYLWLGIYNFASRTPLMNLNAAFFLSILGDNYWIYQVVSTILNSLFILPVYLLCREIVKKRSATMIIALLFLSPSILHSVFYPWPKLFAAYLILLAAYFYLKHSGRDRVPDGSICVLVFLLIWTGFFAHQSSLFSSVVILLDMFFLAIRKQPKRLLFLGVTCLLCFLLINGPWFGWATILLGTKQSFFSYYVRPASTGGTAGYLILFTYHNLATICSPLFVYEVAGKQFDALRFFENIQALYYNSLVGVGTLTVFVGAVLALIAGLRGTNNRVGYADFALRKPVRYALLVASIWCVVMSALVFLKPGFGEATFTRYFNHPQLAQRMFGAYFLAGGLAFAFITLALGLVSRSRTELPSASGDARGATLLIQMAILGFAGGIATHHELYIHGIVSAGSATAVLLATVLLVRVCSDLSKLKRLILAIPILTENFLITWLPLLIIKFNWGWADEKNWSLKREYSLTFLSDLLPDAWPAMMALGVGMQIGMLLVWCLAGRKGSTEGES